MQVVHERSEYEMKLDHSTRSADKCLTAPSARNLHVMWGILASCKLFTVLARTKIYISDFLIPLHNH